MKKQYGYFNFKKNQMISEIPSPISDVRPCPHHIKLSDELRLNCLPDYITTDLREESAVSPPTHYIRFLFSKDRNHLNQRTTFDAVFKIKPYYGKIPTYKLHYYLLQICLFKV